MSDLLLINKKYNPYRQKLSISKRKKSRSKSSKIPKLTTKYTSYRKKMKLARKMEKPVDTYNKIIFNMTYSRYPIIEEIAREKFGWHITKNLNLKWDIFWTDVVRNNLKKKLIFIFKSIPCEAVRSLELHQKMNHFPGMYNLHRKSNLAKNLKKMRKSFPRYYDFFPKTFVMPSEHKDLAGEFGITKKQSYWSISGKFVKKKSKNF